MNKWLELHYQFKADRPFSRSDVILKDSLLYLIRTQNDRISRLCLMANLEKEEIEKIQNFRAAFRLAPTRDDTDFELSNRHRGEEEFQLWIGLLPAAPKTGRKLHYCEKMREQTALS